MINDWTPILAAIVTALPPTLVALVAMRRSAVASEKVATLSLKMDGYMLEIRTTGEQAAAATATANERALAAERAAEAAIEVAKVVAAKAELDQDAAESRTPEGHPP